MDARRPGFQLHSHVRFVVTCGLGSATESALQDELVELGASPRRAGAGAAAVDGPLELAYRVLLWSRVASRVLVPLSAFPAPDDEALYAGVRRGRWAEWLAPGSTLAVRAVASGRPGANTHYAALRTKDAVCDRLRDERGARPDVDVAEPGLQLHLFLRGDEAQLSVDLGGARALHLRGYRPRGARAPLKENLAATLLRLAGYRGDVPFIDPMCGSGTLLVEAAWIARDVAPGASRRSLGSPGWTGHDRAAYDRLLAEADDRRRAGATRALAISGQDASRSAVAEADEALRRAGVSGVRVERRALRDARPAPGPPGLLVTNPPYGDRLGETGELLPLYETLGDVLRRRFPGYRAFVLTGNRALAKRIGLRAARRHVVHNGGVECRLLEIPIRAAPPPAGGPGWRRPSEESVAFRNRLRKNALKARRWASRRRIECYRVYDADVPEFNVAVDVYGAHAHVQEYHRPRWIDPEVARRRLSDVLAVVADELALEPARVHLKVRARQRGGQYERRGDAGDAIEVSEGGHRFVVNLDDYLDTGLFLDQRRLRREIGERSRGERFLNLFAYTCTATVYAARGGARASTSVDLSHTYLEWGRRNLRLNGVDERAHELVRGDCVEWLETATARYDRVLLAPPAFSRSKAMHGDLDLVRDHAGLIELAARRLSPGGTLYFVTHVQRFDLVPPEGRSMIEITDRTLPEDFARSPHRVFELTRPARG